VRLRTPTLDFIVIGAQKSGTTSLWRYLEDNPAVRMPPDKEAPFFSEAGYPHELRAYMRALFKDAPGGAVLGTVTPTYMHGVPGVSVSEIASRIHATAPQVRLIALLREPVERALSAHRMATATGEETRTFERAVEELLAPEALESARGGARLADSYVVAGEYGRILGAYLRLFPRDRLHVELTSELAANPSAVVGRVCEFLGVTPHEPARLGQRFFPSGEPRVSAEAEADLKSYLAQHVWPRVRYAEQHRQAFERWFRLWNVVPEPSPPVDPAVEARLRAHYAEDGRLLSEALGLTVPW
jgi:hypothetical protein